MAYFNITFRWSKNTFCANIAKADSIEAVKEHYSDYEIISITSASAYDVEDAKRRGKPIVSC